MNGYEGAYHLRHSYEHLIKKSSSSDYVINKFRHAASASSSVTNN